MRPLYKSVSDCLCSLPPTFILPRVSVASGLKQTLAYLCSVHSETPFLLSGPSSSHPCRLRISCSLLHMFYVTPWLSHSFCWFGQSTHSDNWRFVPWKSEHWEHWGQVDEAYWLYSYFQWIWLRHINSVSNCHFFLLAMKTATKFYVVTAYEAYPVVFGMHLLYHRIAAHLSHPWVQTLVPVHMLFGYSSLELGNLVVELETWISKTGIPSLFQWVSRTLKQNTVVTHLNPVLFLLSMCYWPKCGSRLGQSHQYSFGTKPAGFIFSYPWTCG